eukprot:CAMPEP_0117490768 /NCGR_PEP_ID=MMETSP0784-20121206/17719_1 /TAXON_ID=39447 /ORGANISM="" /LENGTH=76 /DNA_ID=CAMNT_0005285533 /DNA_START=659 /DNA_END=889 /DNA_ORIENTATION=+
MADFCGAGRCRTLSLHSAFEPPRSRGGSKERVCRARNVTGCCQELFLRKWAPSRFPVERVIDGALYGSKDTVDGPQ